jgi:cell division protein FtsN
MKKQLTQIFCIFLSGALFFFGCSASDVTEEYEGGQKDVVYQTEKPSTTEPTPTPSQTEVTVTTQPEYIPQGPPTPPPPPLKVTLKSEQPATETTPSLETPQYLYKVQVFAFKSRLNAESAAKKIRQRMPDQQVYVEFQDNLYKVRLGTYSRWEHAKGIKDALFNLGYTDSFIITETK